MVRRIRMDLCYLNSSDFACLGDLLGSLGLRIFELGLPLTWTETDKILTQMDHRINKFQPMSKFLLFIASHVFIKCARAHFISKLFNEEEHPIRCSRAGSSLIG